MEHPEGELGLGSCEGPNPHSLTGRDLGQVTCPPLVLSPSKYAGQWAPVWMAAPRCPPGPSPRTGRGERGVARMLSVHRRYGEQPPGDGASTAGVALHPGMGQSCLVS